MSAKRPFSTVTSYSFSENIQATLTKDELMEVCIDLKVDYRPSQTKKDISLLLEQNILNTPYSLAQKIPFPELLNLRDLVYAGGQLISVLPLDFTFLVDTCIVLIPEEEEEDFSDANQDPQFQYAISENIRQAFLPVIDGFLIDPVILDMDEKERIIGGLLQLHGALSIKQMLSLIEEATGSAYAESELMNLFMNRIHLKEDMVPFFHGKEFCFATVDLEEPDVLYQVIVNRKDLDYRRFSLDEIMEAAKPDHAFDEPGADELLTFLYGKTDQFQADMLFLVIWNLTQNDVKISEIIRVMNETFTWESNEEINSFMRVLTNYQNQLPHWVLKGHTPNELHSINPRYTGSLLESATLASPNQNPFAQMQRVGRNDNCPCGSGKKYKKCCGAN